MKEFTINMLNENSLWNDQSEKDKISNNKKRIRGAFWVNFWGIFGLFAKYGNDQKLLSYLKSSPSRVDKVTDDDIDFMIVLKVFKDNDFLPSDNINKITKLLAKIKTGGLKSLDENMFRDDIVKKIKTSPIRAYKEVMVFHTDFKKGNKTLSEILPELYNYCKKNNYGLEFQELYKKLKNKTVEDEPQDDKTDDPIKSAFTGKPLITKPKEDDVIEVDNDVTWNDVQHYFENKDEILSSNELFTLFLHYLFSQTNNINDFVNKIGGLNIKLTDLKDLHTYLDYWFCDNYSTLFSKYPEAQKLIKPIDRDFGKIPQLYYDIFEDEYFTTLIKSNLITSDIEYKKLYELVFKFYEYPDFIASNLTIYPDAKTKLKTIMLEKFKENSYKFFNSFLSAKVVQKRFTQGDAVVIFDLVFKYENFNFFDYFTEETYRTTPRNVLNKLLTHYTGNVKDIYKKWYIDFSKTGLESTDAFKIANDFLSAEDKIVVLGGVSVTFLNNIFAYANRKLFYEIFAGIPFNEFIKNNNISEDELASHFISNFADKIIILIDFATMLYDPKKYEINEISYDISSFVLKVLEKTTKDMFLGAERFDYLNGYEVLEYCENLKRSDLVNKFILYYKDGKITHTIFRQYIIQKFRDNPKYIDSIIETFFYLAKLNKETSWFSIKYLFDDQTILQYAKDIVDILPENDTWFEQLKWFSCNLYQNEYYKALFNKYFNLKNLHVINIETKKNITHLISKEIETEIYNFRKSPAAINNLERVGVVYFYIMELVYAKGITKDEAAKLIKDSFGDFDNYKQFIIKRIKTVHLYSFSKHLSDISFEMFSYLFDSSKDYIDTLVSTPKFKTQIKISYNVNDAATFLGGIAPFINIGYNKFGTETIIEFFDTLNDENFWYYISSGKRLLSKTSEFGNIFMDIITSPEKRKDIDLILNKLPEKIQKGFISAIKENMIMIPLLHDLKNSSNPLKPKIALDSNRIKELLKYNNFKISTKGLNKKKKETYAEYFERLETNKDLLKQIPEVKIEKIEETQDQLNEKTVEYSKYYNGKHGDSAVEFLESYNVNMEYPEWKEFENRFETNMLIPAFHGSGLIASNFILRFGFTVIPANDGSTTGRMLDIDNMTLVKPVSAGEPLSAGNDYVAYIEDGYFPIDSYASSKDVDWNEYGDTSKYHEKTIKTVGGIYISDILEKTAQYLGDDGFSRRKGTVGVIYEMDANLGDEGLHYKSAGTGGDSIRSPEYSVCWPKGQLRIKKAHKVKFSSKKYIKELKKQYPNALKENKYFSNFAEYLQEEKVLKNKNVVSYVFLDGYVPNGKGKFIDWKTFEKKIIKNSTKMRFESDQRGTHLLFETKKDIQGVYVIPDTTDFISEDPEGLYSRFKMLLDECK